MGGKAIAIIFLFVVVAGLGLFFGGVGYEKIRKTKSEHKSGCTYSDWGPWSACYSSECGKTSGTQFRVRNVLQMDVCGPHVCPEPTTEEQSCNVPCSGCEYSDWGVWSECYSPECGKSGTQFRVRDVLKVCGTCSEPTTQKQECKEGCSECQYSNWSNWSECTQECGASGIQFRVRNVLEVCGQCSKPTTEEQSCNRVCYNGGILTTKGCDCLKTTYSGQCCDCKNIDCELSSWTAWSSCENATNRVRSRDVVRESECAGTKCKGPYTEEQNCGIALKGKVLVSKPGFIALNVITAVVLTISFIYMALLFYTRHKRNVGGAATYVNYSSIEDEKSAIKG
ncbi:spondin-1-like [Antedon mediterranea]|uniref:spondin-1-like n=1 Tax=Antedon mediterranea TaxID=105859 RepID=UPI003AF83A62